MATIISISGETVDRRELISVAEFDLLLNNAENPAVVRLGGDPAKRFGVSLAPEQAVESLEPVLATVGLVVLNFPGFADGRAFSQARLLRERHGYTADLRASGEVVQDQLAFMLSCGFNQFELTPGQAPLDLASALAEARQFANALAGTTVGNPRLDRRMSI